MRNKVIYYGGDMEGINGKRKDRNNQRQNNKKDGRDKAQSFICASNILFIDNSINRKSL